MKKYLFIAICFLSLFILTGCFKRYDMENINIVTTNYPIEYITNKLYGDNSDVFNMYPAGVSQDDYKLTDKQLKDYSKNDLLIYNGAKSTTRDYAKTMLNLNKNLKIIDASYGIDSYNTYSDVWLNPSNFLMLAQNVKNELKSYISNKFVKEDIDERYESLKVDVAALESSLKVVADNSVDKRIVCIDETMNFLSKYGFEVINLTKDSKEDVENVDKALDLYNNGSLSYVFVPEYYSGSDLLDRIKDAKAEVITFRSLETIKEEDLNKNEDFLSLMHENISLISKETY